MTQEIWRLSAGILAVFSVPTYAAEATVAIDAIIAGGGESARLVEARPGQSIGYAVTARVERDDNETTTGLGGAYVTLHCDFGAADPGGEQGVTTLARASGVAGDLGAYRQAGLARRGKVTDIGGCQDLIGGAEAKAIANGKTEVIASGTITVPWDVEDGVYPIRVEPQIVSVIDLDAAKPRHRPPDHTVTGGGFFIVVGDVKMHTLRWAVVNADQGDVTVTPNLPQYPHGATVTLTAKPYENKAFCEWRHYDPNDGLDPKDESIFEDANYYTADANLSITVVMDQDRIIVGVYECGNGLIPSLPLIAVGLLGVVYAARRLRLHT